MIEEGKKKELWEPDKKETGGQKTRYINKVVYEYSRRKGRRKQKESEVIIIREWDNKI